MNASAGRLAARRDAMNGFTLLEVVLTSVLMATLLAGMWSLLHIYTRLFETGQTRSEQAQLVRSLLRQFSDDVRSAIQDTAARPSQTPATTPLRRFGLFGTSQSLQFDIMRVAPPEDHRLPLGPAADSTVDLAELPDDSGPKAPEFRTVLYSFEEPVETLAPAGEGGLAAEDDRAQPRPGLTRRELDWELPQGGGRPSWEDSQLRSAVPVAAESSDPLASDPLRGPSLDDLVADDAVMYVPEVISAEFRYFDGRSWTSSWNSIQRKSLPAAIEIRLQLQPSEDAKKASPTDPAQRAEGVEFVEEQNPSDLNALAAEAGPPVDRLVVYLPVSMLERPEEKTGPLTERIKAGVPNRAAQRLEGRRQRYRIRGDSAAPPADQHLRTP
ncbi:MAG: hypothetical protein HUU20_09135 [Pirellulales bacterium]|nr:hypothetical protein [Pirellulales bacterium]